MSNRWIPPSTVFEGPDLSGDYLNVEYAQALVKGQVTHITRQTLNAQPKDCGHASCGLLCDVLLRQVRSRRRDSQEGRV